MYKIKTYLFISLFFFLLEGCVYDDMSDCNNPVSLRMIYTLNKDYTDKFPDYVEYVDFYVYDQDKELILEEQVTTSSLLSGNTHYLDLPAGKYTTVIWGNKDAEDYDVKDKEALEEMSLALIREEEDRITRKPADLFHGIISFEVGTQETQKTVSMIKNTNHIHILVEVPISLRSYPDTEFSVRMYGSNGLYKYDNSRIASQQLQYIPSYSKYTQSATDYIQADFKTLRLFIGDGVRVMIMKGTEVLIVESLTDLLLQSSIVNNNEDLDRYDDYTLLFTVDEQGDYTLSAIQVNDWDVIWEPGGEI